MSFRGEPIRVGEDGWTEAAIRHIGELNDAWIFEITNPSARNIFIDYKPSPEAEAALRNHDILVKHMTIDWHSKPRKAAIEP